MTITSAISESIQGAWGTVSGAAVDIGASYRRVFSEERWARAFDLLAFSAFHIFAMVPLTASLLHEQPPNGWLQYFLGSLWAATSYPFAYPETGPSGLLRITIAEYFKTRGIALLGSWLVAIFAPLILLWELRYLLVLLVLAWWAYLYFTR